MNSSSTRREEAVVGLFVLIAAALLIFTVFSLAGFFNRGNVQYRAFFKNAGGLRPGAEVHYAGGPPVGRVEAVRTDARDTTRMEIIFSIKPDVPVKTDSVAASVPSAVNVQRPVLGGSEPSGGLCFFGLQFRNAVGEDW